MIVIRRSRLFLAVFRSIAQLPGTYDDQNTKTMLCQHDFTYPKRKFVSLMTLFSLTRQMYIHGRVSQVTLNSNYLNKHQLASLSRSFERRSKNGSLSSVTASKIRSKTTNFGLQKPKTCRI